MLKLTDYRSKRRFSIPEHQVTSVEDRVTDDDAGKTGETPVPFCRVWALSPIPLPLDKRPPGMLTNFTVMLHPFEVEESYDEINSAIGGRPHPQTLNFQ